MKMVGSRDGMDRYGKPRPPQGFDSRTVQPVASRYTDPESETTDFFSKRPEVFTSRHDVTSLKTRVCFIYARTDIRMKIARVLISP